MGLVLNEKAGITNLGTEGIMLVGAMLSASVYYQTGNILLTLMSVILGAGILGFVHAFLCITLCTNQIVSGLAITLFGTGFSSYMGKGVAGIPIVTNIPTINLSFLSGIPFINQIFSQLNIFIWISIALAIVLYIYMYKTSWGLHLKAVGDNPSTSDAMGVPVVGIRYFHVIVGSMLMGLTGFY